MQFSCKIYEILSETDKEMLYNVPFEIKNISHNNINNKKVVPTIIDRALSEVLNTEIPEQLNRNLKDFDKLRFSVTGSGINVEFDIKGRRI